MHLEMPYSCGFQAKNFHVPSLEYIGRFKEGIAPTVKQEIMLTPSFENTASCRIAEIRNQEFRKEIGTNEEKNYYFECFSGE